MDSQPSPLTSDTELNSERVTVGLETLDPDYPIPAYQVATLLHEVRNPITTLQTLAKLLKKRLGSDHEHYWISTSIEHECLHLQGLLSQFEHDLTLFSASELIDEQSLNILEFLTALCSMYEVMAESRDIQFSLQWDHTQHYPPLALNATTLRQVLGNLIDNSCKYTQAGGEVQVCLSRVNDTIMIDIKDTGHGIPSPQLEHIFDPYYRANTEKPGKGLGLAITKDLIQQLGGTIEVESEVGMGSLFRVKLPIDPTPCSY